MIAEVRGDILEVKIDAIAHGCNTQGIMNAGLARVLKKRYPAMYREYKSYCEAGLFQPGDVHFYRNPEKNNPHIINVATQVDLRRGAAKLEDVRRGLEKLEESYGEWGLTNLALPRIGCGLGGLKWRDVREAVRDVFSDSDLEVVIVSGEE